MCSCTLSGVFSCSPASFMSTVLPKRGELASRSTDSTIYLQKQSVCMLAKGCTCLFRARCCYSSQDQLVSSPLRRSCSFALHCSLIVCTLNLCVLYSPAVASSVKRASKVNQPAAHAPATVVLPPRTTTACCDRGCLDSCFSRKTLNSRGTELFIVCLYVFLLFRCLLIFPDSRRQRLQLPLTPRAGALSVFSEIGPVMVVKSTVLLFCFDCALCFLT